VRAGKAYISSLGTTGLLVASSAMLLVVVGTLLAFDAWPVGQSSPAEIVSVAAAPDRVVGKQRAAMDRRAAGAGRTSAQRRRRGGRRARNRDAAPGTVRDPVISVYPAPDSGPANTGGGSDGGGGSGGAPTAPVGGQPASGPGAGSDATAQVGGSISGVSPQAGQAITGIGDTVPGTLGGSLSTPALPAAP
jgi:hypothetical protein